MRVVRHYGHGEPEVLRIEETETPEPGVGEALIRAEAIGVNFNAAQRRRGIGPLPSPLPGAPGGDVVGTVVATGPGVSTVRVGDRVAAIVPNQAYAEYVVADTGWLAPIPSDLPVGVASALGAPAQVALGVVRTARVRQGDSVLVHGAAGAIGQIAVQLAKLQGAGQVVATGGSQSKLDYARAVGADVAVNYSAAGWSDQVRQAVGGSGVDAALDGVGGEVFTASLNLLAPLGRLVFYGTASGAAAPSVAPFELIGLKYVVGSSFGAWRAHRPDEVRTGLSELIDHAAAGRLHVEVRAELPLTDVVRAHRMVEDRAQYGRVLLRP